jgi:peptidoglycan/xylan/chitin deacetylase (PgdA/CDA1 family)
MNKLSENILHSRGPKVPVLMYHGVSNTAERDNRARSTNPSYCLSLQAFREQMNWLAENRFSTLPLQTLLEPQSLHDSKAVVITFDDGWLNNCTDAFPILKERDLLATVFVVTGFIGRSGYMNWNQLKEMSRGGVSIQSHTVNHLPLTILPVEQIRHELAASKMCLEDHLGSRVDFLSLPHGMGNSVVYDLAEEIGYRAVCTSEPGYSHSFGPLTVLKRVNVAGRYGIDEFRKIVERDRMMTVSLVLSKTMKNFVKKVLGYRSYRAMYRLRYQSKD